MPCFAGSFDALRLAVEVVVAVVVAVVVVTTVVGCTLASVIDGVAPWPTHTRTGTAHSQALTASRAECQEYTSWRWLNRVRMPASWSRCPARTLGAIEARAGRPPKRMGRTVRQGDSTSTARAYRQGCLVN